MFLPLTLSTSLVWDNTIHNFKLTETVDDLGANEWDQYLFTVRRKFDWDNKYLETVVDIKSKHLRDALSKVMDGVKGVSLVQETAVVDPNMLFLYLEETRQYMRELKQQAKTEKKKKARNVANVKAQHLKVLLKYLDTDYAETKKTLYPPVGCQHDHLRPPLGIVQAEHRCVHSYLR